MANSGSITSAPASSQYFNRTITLSWSVKSQSIANNTTTISWALRGSGGATNNWVVSGNFKVVIDGVQRYFSATRVNLYNGTTVASGEVTLSHNNVGDRSFSASIEAGIGYVAVSQSASGSWALPKIPRYPTANQSVKSKTETTIVMNYSSDSTCDYLWYSTNNGSSWSGINIADGTSGTYTISGLSAGATYQVKTRLRRKDSQLTKDSSAISVTTYNYPYANSMPNFTIGNSLTVGLYNPLKRSVKVYLVGANGTERGGDTTTGTSISGYNNSGWQSWLYGTIPSAKSGAYKVKVVYGSVTTTKNGGTYSINTSNCTPTIGGLTYADVNSTVTAITGNNQKIVQNQSTVRYTATGLAAKNGASISSIKVAVNGKTYNLTISGSSATGGNAAINSASSVTATATITDSRGLTATRSVNVNMLSWALPTAITTMQRRSNYYSETTITVDASYSSVDAKNTITIQLRYKKTADASYSAWQTMSDNVARTFTLDNEYAWDVQVKLTDRFNGTTTYNLTLTRGMPIIFFDRILSSVGINCFPIDSHSLEVNGVPVNRNVMTRSLSAEITNLAVNTYTAIPLDLANSSGSRLTTTSNGGIKIGAGVHKVLVSGRMAVLGIKTAGDRHLRIAKNNVSVNTTLGWSYATLPVSNGEDITITPTLVDVTPGDVINMYYYTPQSNDRIGGNSYGARTSLTVEVIA